MGVKSLKALPHADSALPQIKADTGETFIPVSIEDAVCYWQAMSKKGNAKADALMIALAAESIERRIDAALGIEVDEEERNRQLADRIARLEARHQWTDVIKAHQERMGYYQTDKARVAEEYRALTVRVNQELFGCRHFKCDRDTMTKDQQRTIQLFEGMLRRQADKYPTLDPERLVERALALF